MSDALPTFQNPCGGLRWAFLPDGQVLFEGEDAPRTFEGEAAVEYLENTWKNFSGELQDAARSHDVPAPWLLAVATVETGLWSKNPDQQATITSPMGAIGLMQIMPVTAKHYGYLPSEMTDPARNADAGAKVLADLSETMGDVLGALGPYNSGHKCCPGKNALALCTANVYGTSYGEAVAALNNTAIQRGLVSGGTGKWLLIGLALVAAWAVWGRR